MSYVQIDDFTKSYNNIKVLNQVSLTIEKGELVTLLGPSGCGKSTLLRCMAGLTPIESNGRILLDNIDITNLPPKQRGIGMLFQSYALFPNMTVFDNVSFGLMLKGLSKKEYTAKAQKMIDLVDLRGREGSYPHQLSGGQQQRVALARSLVVEPKVLLLDEPLSALDAKIRKNLQVELKRIQTELSITTIFVTHDQEEALTISDRIFIMDQGKVVQAGSPEQIYTRPASDFVARFVGNYNVISGQQLERLVGSHGLAGKSFAIRPEVISLFPEQANPSAVPAQDWLFEGTVRDIIVIGNVIRCQVESQGERVLVDYLNTADHYWIKKGMKIKVRVPKEECLALEYGS